MGSEKPTANHEMGKAVGFVIGRILKIMDAISQRVTQISDFMFVVMPESCPRGVNSICDNCEDSKVEFRRVTHARKSLFEIGYVSCPHAKEQPQTVGKEERWSGSDRRADENQKKFDGPYDKDSKQGLEKDRRYDATRSPVLRCYNCLTLNRVPQDKLLQKPVCGSCKTVLEFPNKPIWAKSDGFDRAVAYWPETLLVVFTTPLCMYSKIVDPVLNDLALRKAAKLKIMKVDIEKDRYLEQRFKIEKTPTFIIFKNGVKIIRVDGAPKDKNDLVRWIDNLIDHTYY